MSEAVFVNPGRMTRCVGGLYSVYLDPGVESSPLSGQLIHCRARGKFRYHGLSPKCGDIVQVAYTENSFVPGETPVQVPTYADISLVSIMERKNELIRPPMANLDLFFIVLSAKDPVTPYLTIDKLTCIAEHNRIRPVLLITKADLCPEQAEHDCALYRSVGYDAFILSSLTGTGLEELSRYLRTELPGKVACLAGVSGAGKSSLLNRLFPGQDRATGALSEKIQRGRNTTREITLFPAVPGNPSSGWIADTPGFSLIDFERFDFFNKDDLPQTFPEFLPYLGQCRYRNCTHTKEEGCRVLEAVRDGIIPVSRHDSFLSLYEDLKDKHDWD